jgi:DNA polymerase III epsilon subunit-like protein
MYVFFDTETSDLPRNFNAPESDVGNWPHLVQIAWVVGESLDTVSEPEVYLFKPDGFRIAQGAIAVHGISNEFAEANGVPLQPVLSRFVDTVNNATTVVAHNMSFDINIIGAACARAGIANPIRGKTTRCTMQESTRYCRIPSRRRGYKWPTLTELHRKLFGAGFGNAHDAAEDTVACMKCFFRLQELKVM